MPTRTQQREKNTAYFITFTCYKWIHLIEYSNVFHSFYKWFVYMKSEHINTLGYVIMPNHFHGILFVKDECPKSINQVVSNGKRFIAYDIIKGLKSRNEIKILKMLSQSLTIKEKQRGKKHHVFITSFDCKEMLSIKMLQTKLDYIHHNPCAGKWNLVSDFTQYRHSSAAYYEIGAENDFITNYRGVY